VDIGQGDDHHRITRIITRKIPPMADHRIDPVARTKTIERILLADGCTADEARTVADHLVMASLSGHDSHGVIRTMRYHMWIGEGVIRPDTALTTVLDSGPLLQLDGGDGMGQWLAREATEAGIIKAREGGIGLVALRRAGHIGRIGTYAEQACSAGMVSIQFCNVNGSLLVAPFGTARRAIGTDPVAVGIPNPAGDDFILDFATSLVAEGKALVAGSGGKPLPDDALIDAAGHHTGDPRVLYGDTLESANPNPLAGPGALRAMGDHKGSGLALACELLAGALTGNGANREGEQKFGNGLLSIILDPATFDDRGGFGREVADYIDFIQSSPPAAGVERVLIPGDKERALRAERTANGLPMPETVLAGILAVADELELGIGRADLIVG